MLKQCEPSAEDDELLILEGYNKKSTDINGKIINLFKEKGFGIEIKTSIKQVDVTFNRVSEKCQQNKTANNEPIYDNVSSNHFRLFSPDSLFILENLYGELAHK